MENQAKWNSRAKSRQSLFLVDFIDKLKKCMLYE